LVPLFPKDGIPEGWVVRAWNDVSQPPGNSAKWRVENGVLRGGEPRGTWLMSEKQYTNFILEYEFKLGESGNSGLALRAPMKGDPAFDGMELQMADFRYNPQAKDSELTGGIYRAVAPTKQVYKPSEWNECQVILKGQHLKVVFNGETIQDLNLEEQNQEVRRHDGTLPLGWAMHGSENGWDRQRGDYAATVEALLDSGVNLPDKAGGSEAVKAVLQRYRLK
jgi:3-keto-disaccharide hydrolase